MATQEELNEQLVKAAEKGDTAAVQALVKAGADVNAADDDGETALFAAARGGHADAARALIEAGADVDARDESGGTALRYAAFFDHADVVRALIEAGADVNVKGAGGGTPLIHAALRLRGSATAARILIEAGANVNEKADDGATPLILAVKAGSTDTVKALLEAGADVNAQDREGGTALAYAAERGWDELAAALIAAGADAAPGVSGTDAGNASTQPQGDPMILHDVMQQLTLTDLESIVACMYERGIKVDFCKKHGHKAVFGLYMDFVQRLCALTPRPQPEGEEMVLLGYPRKLEPKDEDDQPRSYVNVTMYRQAQLREIDIDAISPHAFLVGPYLPEEEVAARMAALNEKPGDWERFAYEADPWEETLGCEVSWDNICRCGLHAFMAEVLGEMSYYGVNRETQDENRRTLKGRYARQLALLAAMKRKGMTDEEITRAFETGELPEVDEEELEALRRALEEDGETEDDEVEEDETEDDEDENDEAEEEEGDAEADLRSLVDMLTSLLRQEGAKDVVLPAAILADHFPEIGSEDGGEKKEFYTLADVVALAAKRGIDIDLEAMEREREEKETPALLVAKCRVMLWNAAQERRALLDWLGASPVMADMREEGED